MVWHLTRATAVRGTTWLAWKGPLGYGPLRRLCTAAAAAFDLVRMPALSPTMTHGTVMSWCKAEGERVQAGEVLAQIETDKATVDFEAHDDGFVAKILVPAGDDQVAVGTAIAVLVEELSAVAGIQAGSIPVHQLRGTKVSEASAGDTKNVVSQHRATGSTKVLGPAVTRLLNTHQLNPDNILPTGPGGRILKGDILAHLKRQKSQGDTTERAPRAQSAEAQRHTPGPPAAQEQQQHLKTEPATVGSPHYTDVPVTTIRRVIANRLTESKKSVPHMYVSASCELDDLMRHRQAFNTSQSMKISLNDCFIKASALALREVPAVNVRWSPTREGPERVFDIDISIAVAIEGGLITPIIKNADRKTLDEISSEVKDLAKRARLNKLKPEEFQGGSFTISNLGMFGIKKFSAVINPPQACILALGGAAREVVAKDWELSSCTISHMTLSCDARVVREDTAGEFLKALTSLLGEPEKLFSNS